MYKYLISFIFTLSIHAQMIGGVAIVVKDKAITLHDIKKEMRITNVNKEVAIDTLIRQKLEEVEINERKIKVTSSEVYNDIKQTAKRNNMGVNQFYQTVLNSQGINSTDLKKKIKQKLLATKLYTSIAYSQASRPTQSAIEEYFNLHKIDFIHPVSFSVVIYQSSNTDALQKQIRNPMSYSPEIATNEQVLPYNRIAPELAKILTQTKVRTFTPIIPSGEGLFMTLYISEIENAQADDYKVFKDKIENTLMSQNREKTLSDYFARLRHNADITTLRTIN